MISLIKEEDNSQLTLLVPKCGKCDQVMGDIKFHVYKDPNMTQYTEAMGAFFWTDFVYQCRKCWGTIGLSKEEIEIMNSYPLDKINFPPGMDSKNLKLQKL